MARTNGSKTDAPSASAAIAEFEAATETGEPVTLKADSATPAATSTQAVDDSLNALKTLLSAVEKLQKVRQEVGDIKPLLIKMLDGEVIVGEELEQLKTGVSGLFRLVRAYSDHQTALTNAQPARQLLDEVLQVRSS